MSRECFCRTSELLRDELSALYTSIYGDDRDAFSYFLTIGFPNNRAGGALHFCRIVVK